MRFRATFLIALSCVLVSCAEITVKSTVTFDLSERNYLYDKSIWSFSGRLAFSDNNASHSASINWEHQAEFDLLELAGPFGQGRTLIQLFENKVVIDYGNGQQHYVGDVDELVSRHTGISIPVSALRYWVLGIIEPGVGHSEINNGFSQAGWRVIYLQMHAQSVGLASMPKKIRVVQSDVKLKLIINEWDI